MTDTTEMQKALDRAWLDYCCNNGTSPMKYGPFSEGWLAGYRAKEAAAEPPATLSAEEWDELKRLLLDYHGTSSRDDAVTRKRERINDWIAARLATARREGMFEAAMAVPADRILRRAYTGATWVEPTTEYGRIFKFTETHVLQFAREVIATAIRNAANAASTTGTVERSRDTGPGHAQD